MSHERVFYGPPVRPHLDRDENLVEFDVDGFGPVRVSIHGDTSLRQGDIVVQRYKGQGGGDEYGRKKAGSIIEALRDRAGFGDVLSSLDEQTRGEIEAEFAAIIGAV